MNARSRSTHLVVLALAALGTAMVLATPAGASSPVSVGCLIDKVILQPEERPDTAQIWGTCAVATSEQLYTPFGPAARGYLYYFVPAGKVDLVRREWRDLQSLAGKSEAAAFGDRTQHIPRLRPAAEKPKDPDGYVVSIGVVRIGPGVFLDSLKRVRDGGQGLR